MRPPVELFADAYEARQIVDHFNLLIYACRTGQTDAAEEHAKALFALGVVVQFPTRGEAPR